MDSSHVHPSSARRSEVLGITFYLKLHIYAALTAHGNQSNARRTWSAHLSQHTTSHHAHEQSLDRSPRRTWILIDSVYQDVGVARLLQLERATPVERFKPPFALSNIGRGCALEHFAQSLSRHGQVRQMALRGVEKQCVHIAETLKSSQHARRDIGGAPLILPRIRVLDSCRIAREHRLASILAFVNQEIAPLLGIRVASHPIAIDQAGGEPGLLQRVTDVRQSIRQQQQCVFVDHSYSNSGLAPPS